MSYSSTSILALAIHFLINHNLLKKDMSKDAIPALLCDGRDLGPAL